MTTAGWIIMIISVSAVTTLFSTCIFKVLTSKVEEEHMHGMEIDTLDKD